MEIIIADDHPVFREGVRRLVQRALPEASIFEADTFQAVLNLAQGSQPTLFVLDLGFPGFDPATSIRHLRKVYPASSILIISMKDDQKTMGDILALGVDGFISKAIDPVDIGVAIMDVLNGDIVVRGPEGATQLPATGQQSDISHLPPRQREVLQLIVEGKTNKEIARDLDLSPFTVRSHVSALLQSLAVTSRAAAAAMGREIGL